MMLYRAIGSAAEDKIIRIAQARINSSKVMPCSERSRLRLRILRILQALADYYGCTCTVASTVTMIVPVPLTPAVFGCRVAEIIACPCSFSLRFAEPHPEHTMAIS